MTFLTIAVKNTTGHPVVLQLPEGKVVTIPSDTPQGDDT